MIDWIKASLPFQWDKAICGGHFVVLDRDNKVERQMVKSEHVRGSHSEHVTLRTIERGRLEFDGNPSKFLQCHNLFGSDDLRGLLVAAVLKALRLLGVDVVAADVERWRRGEFAIARVDLTESFELDCEADVQAWLRAASEGARMRYRGKATAVGSTLYFGKVAAGKRASPWSLKVYAKGEELRAAGKSHKLPEGIEHRDKLAAWASNKLRVELLLRSAELKKRDKGKLMTGAGWDEETAGKLFAEYSAKIELGTTMSIERDKLDEMKPAVRMAYAAWEAGQDLAAVLPRATFFRYRSKILAATGGEVDLNVKRTRSNVVPLVRVLTARPASPPAWAVPGSSLMFRRVA